MTSHGKATGKSERLSVLNDAEQEALYGLPDFDEEQQWEFLSLSAGELELATCRPGLPARIYCILQIGYFKAKHAFFRFTPQEVEADYEFVTRRYFREASFTDKTISDNEYYTQRKLIADFFGYRLWSGSVTSDLNVRATQIVCRDITPGFVATELICWLNENKIIRPGYSTLQKIISAALSAERQRLADILSSTLDSETRDGLKALLKKEGTLSGLAELKQEAKNFRWRQMTAERKKKDLLQRQQESKKVGRLLSLFVDETVADVTSFGEVRQRAWKIMPRDTLQSTAQRMQVKPVSRMGRRWEAVDTQMTLIRRHLRPLFCALDFSSLTPECPWLTALAWVKAIFSGKLQLTDNHLFRFTEGGQRAWQI